MPPLLAALPVLAGPFAGATATASVGAGLTAAGTFAGMSSWLLPALSVVGLGTSAMGAMNQGATEAKIMEANANASEMEAKSIQEMGKAESLRLSRESNQMVGKQATIMSGAGLDLSSGSPLDVMANTAANYESDMQMLGYSADTKAAAKNYEATIYDWAAPLKRKAGMIGAGGTLLAGLGTMGRASKYGLPTYGYGT